MRRVVVPLLLRAGPVALALGLFWVGLTRAPAWRLASPARPAVRPPLSLPAPLGRLSLGRLRVVRAFGWTTRAGRPWFAPDLRLSRPSDGVATAVAPGRVWAIGDDPSEFGLYVVVAHGGGWATLYGGCTRVVVRVAMSVPRGAPLCEVGSEPAAPGGLTFGLFLDGRAVDPGPYGMAGAS